jgi:hypothetical protein
MDDRFTKYSKLYLLIFLLFLSVPVIFALIVGTLYGLSTLISSKPVDIFYELVVITIPPAIFATAYYIFIKRTKHHPAAAVKVLSKVILITGFCICLIISGWSIIDYFKIGMHNITDYKSFSLPFLAGNVTALFVVALLQAFTTKKEEDWMKKREKK